MVIADSNSQLRIGRRGDVSAEPVCVHSPGDSPSVFRRWARTSWLERPRMRVLLLADQHRRSTRIRGHSNHDVLAHLRKTEGESPGECTQTGSAETSPRRPIRSWLFESAMTIAAKNTGPGNPVRNK